MFHQSPSSESNRKDQFSPKNSQWGLLNQQRAMEYQRAKSMQKLIQNQKKNNFKAQLDNQLNSKSNYNIAQKQADKRYYEFITMQAQQMKRNQQRVKLQKHMKRKMAQQYNMRVIQQNRQNQIKNDQAITFSIGHKSEQLKKQRQEQLKKVVMDELDHQVQMKQLQKKQNRQRQIEEYYKNQMYQDSQDRSRTLNLKRYRQNQDVYNYYSSLNKEKQFLQKQAEYKIVNQAAIKKQYEEDQRNLMLQQKKIQQAILMKKVLSHQLHEKQVKKIQQNQTNPEDANYQMFNSMFQDKKKYFDKREYQNILKNQMEAQKRSKLSQQFMTDEQYRLNMNQLNKAVNGQYAHQTYCDNSLTAIGEKANKYLAKQNNPEDQLHQRSRIIDNQNASMVRQKLDDMLQRRSDKATVRNDKFF